MHARRWVTRLVPSSVRRIAHRRWLVRGAVALVAPAVAVSLSGLPAQAAPAKAAPKRAMSLPTEAGDRVSALMLAKTSGHAVEITSERTERATTWVLPSGAFRTDVAGGVIRVRGAGGEWTPVDYSLVRTANGWVPKAGPVAVRFSAGGSGPLASIGKGKDAVSLNWPTVVPAPTVAGPTATYRLSATENLVLTATATGYEQSVVLTARPTTTPKIALTFSGAPTLRSTTGGGFAFHRSARTAARAKAVTVGAGAASAEQLIQVPAPVMYSAAVDARTGEHTQVRTLTAKATPSLKGAGRLDLSAAMDFLNDPATKYPVTIDPVIASVSRIGDTYVLQGDTQPKVNDYSIFAGPTTAGVQRRALLRFGAGAALAGMHVTNATLNLYTLEAATCTAKPLNAYPVTADYNMGLAVWTNQPTVSTAPATAATASFSHGFTGCARGWDSINITNMTQAWANAPATDFGLELQGDELDNTSGKRFCAMDIDTTGLSASCSTTANLPYLSVTYNSIPGTPTGLTWSPRITGTDGARVATSLTPTFSAVATNADGGNYRLEVEVSHNPAFPAEGTGVFWTGTSPDTTPGAPAYVTAPAGTFAVGSHITFRARAVVTNAVGGTDVGSWTTSNDQFYFNVNPPQVPSIICPNYPTGLWTTQAAGAVSCTIDTASTDGSSYLWSLDNPTPTNEIDVSPNWGSPGAITITPAPGWHTLYGLARDTARHASPVASIQFGVQDAAGVGGGISPADGDVTAKAVALTGSAPAVYTQVKWQYALGTTTTFVDIPVTDVAATGSSTAIPSWPRTGTTSGNVTTFTGLNWNVAATTGSAFRSGQVLVRPCFSSATLPQICAVTPRTFQLANTSFASDANVTEVGPAKVSLTSGDSMLTAGDVSVGGLSVARIATTLSPVALNAGPNGIFGLGWAADLPGPDSAYGNFILIDNSAQGSVTLKDADGTELIYAKQPDGRFRGLGEAADGTVLQKSTTITDPTGTSTGTVTGWQLRDPMGGVTTWTQATITAPWTVRWVDAAGSEGMSTFARDGAGHVTAVLGQVPAGVSCTTSTLVKGCFGLALNYSATTTATAAVPGAFAGTVASIDWKAWNPAAFTSPNCAGTGTAYAANTMITLPVSCYKYDSSGRLVQQWDPRVSPNLVTTYTYVGSTGRLSTVKEPGRNAWTLAYDTLGRLASVARTDPSTGVTAKSAIAFDLPVSGTGLPELSSAAASGWGQAVDSAYSGSAVFPPSHVPPVNATTLAYAPMAVDYKFAALSYADVNGRVVNTAAFGAGVWLIGTTRYDTQGRVVWNLSPGARSQALVPDTATDPYVAAQTTSAARADLLATITSYNADGDVQSVVGPAHPVRLSNGTVASARKRTVDFYDEQAPAGGPYHLLTSTRVDAVTLDGSVPAAADSSYARNGYVPIDGKPLTDATSGWMLLRPTSTTTQWTSAPSSGDVTSQTRYDTVGRVVESRLPGAAAGTAAVTLMTYYSGAANAAVPECGGHVEWAGLLCRTAPGGAASSGPAVPTTTTTYDRYLRDSVVTETSGTATRTSTVTYDIAGRPLSRSIAITGMPGSTSVPMQTLSYSTTTGELLSTIAGAATTATTTNAVGQITSVTDADGSTSTLTYDIDGHRKTMSDGKGTYTFSYDGGSGTTEEHRGLPTSVDAGMGAAASVFTAQYDAAGNPASSTLPNGTAVTRSYDVLGNSRALTYTLPRNGTNAPVVLGFTSVPDILDRATMTSSPASAQVDVFDPAGRLTSVEDARLGACTTRTYGYDQQSDRLTSAIYSAAPGGACQTTTAAGSTTNAYDSANRLSSGYTYDAFGRAMSVPAAQLPSGAAAASVAYYDTDVVKTLTQGAATKEFTVDPWSRFRLVIDKTSGVETSRIVNHYSNGSDSPSWIARSIDGGATFTWQRNVTVLGSLGALQASDGSVTLQLVNLHNDVVATLPDLATAAGTTLSTYGERTEFGLDPGNGSDARRYAWLGGAQRSSDAVAGLMLMGVRMYNPATGQFLSRDPVPGGNANAYNYPADPINSVDLDGKVSYPRYSLYLCHWWQVGCASIRKAYAATIGYTHEKTARLAGASCSTILGLRVCQHTPRWVGWSRGGTTWGTVFLTGTLTRDSTRRANLVHHELEHVHQWRIFGDWFPILYAREGLFNGCTNYFEIKAGLSDGGYNC